VLLWTVHGHQLIGLRHDDVRKDGEGHWLRRILLYRVGQVVGGSISRCYYETTRLGHGHQSQDDMKLVHRGEASKIVWIGDGPYQAEDSSVDAALCQKGHGVLSRNGNTAAAIGIGIVIGRWEDNPKDRVDEIEAIRLFQRGCIVDAVHSFRYDFRRCRQGALEAIN